MKKIILTVSMATLVHAAPALTKSLESKQEDGTTFSATLKGDEWMNWVEDQKGNIIKYSNKSKNFEYAELKEVDGELDLAPAGVKVGSALGTLGTENSKIDQQVLIELWKQKKEKALQGYPSR